MESSLASRMQHLGDLELAILVSLVAEEHCIFSAAQESTSSLQEELRLTCIQTFGLQPIVVDCSPTTTVDEFNDALLVEVDADMEEDGERRGVLDRPLLSSTHFSSSRGRSPGRLASVGTLETRRIADVILATGLDTADDNVQVQVFELLRSKRIFTRSSMHVAPKDLLFIAVLSKPTARLYRHLNDLFCMSHFHAEDDGLPHLEAYSSKEAIPILVPSDIKYLREQTENVPLTAEMAQYLHNIVVFMRNSRFVKGGVTATGTRQLRILCRALAPLHGLDYVPPSLVALAARKIYPHRLILATAGNERSLLWGSDPTAIRELLEGVTVEDVIEEVLASIETPL